MTYLKQRSIIKATLSNSIVFQVKRGEGFFSNISGKAFPLSSI
jgi:hypothetical protein